MRDTTNSPPTPTLVAPLLPIMSTSSSSSSSFFGDHMRISVCCNQGGRKYMEDRVSIHCEFTTNADDDDDQQREESAPPRVDYIYAAVYDGHGGADASTFAKEHLRRNIVRQPGFNSDKDSDVLEAIRTGFIETHEAMRKVVDGWPRTASGFTSTSGTTASIAFIRRGKLYTGHVGDSGIVMGSQTATGEMVATSLTVDHKPDSPEEKKRIEDFGGEVMNKSGVMRVVWVRPLRGHQGPVRRSTPKEKIPFLAVARALGDLWSYNADSGAFVVSPEPDVSVVTLDASHCCLIFGSDGLWNVLRPQYAVDIVNSHEWKEEEMCWMMNQAEGYETNHARWMVRHALMRWGSLRADNISVIVVVFGNRGVSGSSYAKRVEPSNSSNSEDGLSIEDVLITDPTSVVKMSADRVIAIPTKPVELVYYGVSESASAAPFYYHNLHNQVAPGGFFNTNNNNNNNTNVDYYKIPGYTNYERGPPFGSILSAPSTGIISSSTTATATGTASSSSSSSTTSAVRYSVFPGGTAPTPTPTPAPQAYRKFPPTTTGLFNSLDSSTSKLSSLTWRMKKDGGTGTGAGSGSGTTTGSGTGDDEDMLPIVDVELGAEEECASSEVETETEAEESNPIRSSLSRAPLSRQSAPATPHPCQQIPNPNPTPQAITTTLNTPSLYQCKQQQQQHQNQRSTTTPKHHQSRHQHQQVYIYNTRHSCRTTRSGTKLSPQRSYPRGGVFSPHSASAAARRSPAPIATYHRGGSAGGSGSGSGRGRRGGRAEAAAAGATTPVSAPLSVSARRRRHLKRKKAAKSSAAKKSASSSGSAVVDPQVFLTPFPKKSAADIVDVVGTTAAAAGDLNVENLGAQFLESLNLETPTTISTTKMATMSSKIIVNKVNRQQQKLSRRCRMPRSNSSISDDPSLPLKKKKETTPTKNSTSSILMSLKRKFYSEDHQQQRKQKNASSTTTTTTIMMMEEDQQQSLSTTTTTTAFSKRIKGLGLSLFKRAN